MSRDLEMDDLNATQGSLLGFLHDEPSSGWDLVRGIGAGLGRFWNVTPSHVYRELRRLEESGLVVGGRPGPRERRPFSITAAGRRAFRRWLAEPPDHEQIRFPLLVKMWFARHLETTRLNGFFEDSIKLHEARLIRYRGLERLLDRDDDRAAVVRFGIAYEQAVLGWLEEEASRLVHRSS